MSKVQTTEDVLIGLWSAVVRKEIPMVEAEKRIHEYVNGLSEEKREEFRVKARLWGQLLMSVSEAFNQQMVIIAAGQ